MAYQGNHTSIVILELESSERFIVTTLSTRNDTQVITIDPTTGVLNYVGRDKIDTFLSEDDAIQHITAHSRWLIKSTVCARAILGYAVLGNVSLLLVATKLRASIQQFPGGGSVFLVEESQWIKIQLRNPQPLSKLELKNASDLQEMDLDGMYFFSETRDITRPFPSGHLVTDPDKEFVWNEWLSQPFKELGLDHHCVVLLQGFSDSRVFTDGKGQQVTIALTARRSRLHPGTRYLARGLNSVFSTGNEVECEQLVWPSSFSLDKPVPFSVHVWRRGTVPIWWKAEIKSTVAEAEISISESEPYRGADCYFSRISQRYRDQLFIKNTEEQKQNNSVPVVCVNLLRNGVGKPEVILSHHFHKCVDFVNRKDQALGMNLTLIDYDWHTQNKLLGDPGTVNGLWQLLKSYAPTIGFKTGVFSKSDGRKPSDACLIENTVSVGGKFMILNKQRGVVRFNCADSLDRTNAASFFSALQVLVEQCRQLGLSLNSSRGFEARSSFNERKSVLGPLPPGWESRCDAVTGKVFYIDHNTKTTTWVHPCPDEAWRRYDMTVDEFKEATLASPISVLAELFLNAGDVHATLYTGSKAMHSHILQIFSEEATKSNKQYAAAQNMKITLQRRYLNVIVDNTRQKQLEMFLGLRRKKYFPTVVDRQLQVLSRYPACVLKPVQSSFPGLYLTNDLIGIKSKDLVWVCPSAAEIVEVFVFLKNPCHISKLLLTVAHGSDDGTSPVSFDVRAGRYIDGLKLILEGATLPRCANGTKLVYPLGGVVNTEDAAITGAGSWPGNPGEKAFPWLYEFEEQEGEVDFLTRVVALTFYPASPGNIAMTLGQIEILGFSLPWDKFTTSEDEPWLEVAAKGSESQIKSSVVEAQNPFLGFDEKYESTGKADNAMMKSGSTTQSSNILGHGLDFLTGDIVAPVQCSAPETGSWEQPSYKKDESWEIFLTDSEELPDSFEDPLRRSSDICNTEAKSASGEYSDAVKMFCGSGLARRLTFSETAELEILRFRVGLSAAERDRVLLALGKDPVFVDPNRSLSPLYSGQVSLVATQLASINQIAFEDQNLSDIGLNKLRSEISKILDQNDGCEIHNNPKFGKMRNSFKLTGLAPCAWCQRKVCPACSASKEEVALAGNYDASNGSQATYEKLSSTDIICKKCCPQIIIDAFLLDRLKALASERRKSRIRNAAVKAMEEIFGNWFSSIPRNFDQGTSTKGTWLEALLKGEDSLAEYPHASLLATVEAAEGSESPLSLLACPFLGSPSAYWKTPAGVTSVVLTVVLSTPATVSGLLLLVSPCGYSAFDTPTLDVWCGKWITETERTFVGRWDIKDEAAACPHIYGKGTALPAGQVPRHLNFRFKKHEQCRILWLKFTIPATSRMEDVNFDILNLGSMSLSSNKQRPYGGVVESSCIHARRILVVGKRGVETLDTAPQQVSRVAWKSALEQPVLYGRYKVQVEAEAYKESDRIVELAFPASASSVAGFRLDALYTIQNSLKHTPVNPESPLHDLLDSVETLITNRGNLFIQVAAVQDNQQPVHVGNFTVPVAQIGTLLYFDFVTPIQARGLIFELLGDITAFSDERTDQNDTSLKNPPMANGLSLANKIKVYRYSLASEMGKWALLSAV